MSNRYKYNRERQLNGDRIKIINENNDRYNRHKNGYGVKRKGGNCRNRTFQQTGIRQHTQHRQNTSMNQNRRAQSQNLQSQSQSKKNRNYKPVQHQTPQKQSNTQKSGSNNSTSQTSETQVQKDLEQLQQQQNQQIQQRLDQLQQQQMEEIQFNENNEYDSMMESYTNNNPNFNNVQQQQRQRPPPAPDIKGRQYRPVHKHTQRQKQLSKVGSFASAQHAQIYQAAGNYNDNKYHGASYGASRNPHDYGPKLDYGIPSGNGAIPPWDVHLNQYYGDRGPIDYVRDLRNSRYAPYKTDIGYYN